MANLAALYVAPKGAYSKVPGLDLWDEARDARGYAGPYPVVAHPPCTRWCRLAGLVEARWGYKRGEDGGCFAAALASVRAWGGVLEHPAYSDAWKAYGLSKPPRLGGWVKADDLGGWTYHVEQGRYGHPAKKATWLYAHGIDRASLPELQWGSNPDSRGHSLVSWCGNHTSKFDKRPRVGKAAASKTPPAFRDLLISIALSVAKPAEAPEAEQSSTVTQKLPTEGTQE